MHVSVVGNTDDSVVITVRGDLDVDTGVILDETLDRVLDRPDPRVVIDLSGIEFCDSTGLGALVAGDDRARAAGGWLRLAAPGEFVERLLGTAGRTTRLAVFATVGDALAGRGAD